MSKTVDAVYENGVLRPLEPLGLREHQRVTVTVEEAPVTQSDESWLDTGCLQLYAGAEPISEMQRPQPSRSGLSVTGFDPGPGRENFRRCPASFSMRVSRSG